MRAATHESIDIALAWLTTERLQISRQQLGHAARLNERHGLGPAQPTWRARGRRWCRARRRPTATCGTTRATSRGWRPPWNIAAPSAWSPAQFGYPAAA